MFLCVVLNLKNRPLVKDDGFENCYVKTGKIKIVVLDGNNLTR